MSFHVHIFARPIPALASTLHLFSVQPYTPDNIYSFIIYLFPLDQPLDLCVLVLITCLLVCTL
jgi:hypothetical protein